MSPSPVKFRLPILLVLIFISSNAVHAQWWNVKSLFFGSDDKRAETLVVTGNYVSSRVLAELFQLRTKQPFLLLPGNKNDSMYFVSPEKSVEIKSDDYVRFVTFLNPRKVVFLGDERHAPARYIDMLGDRLPVWSIRTGDWEKIADSLGDMFRIKRMLNDYLVLVYQLDDSGNIKPPASTDQFGGYSTDGESWNSKDSTE